LRKPPRTWPGLALPLRHGDACGQRTADVMGS